MDRKELLLRYLGELADRAVRFYLHLDAVESAFYQFSPSLGGDSIPRDKPLFVESFRTCVATVLETTGKLAQACETQNNYHSIFEIARHAFQCINHLHETGLVHLPRPSEPVELRRFCRIISRHVLRRDFNDLAVYVTETTADGAYAADPISEIKTKDFAHLVQMANTAIGANSIQPPLIEGVQTIHVTIPRVDARNPLRWPTLMHEAAHKLLTEELTGDLPIGQQFANWLPLKAQRSLHELHGIKIDKWLTEIWCDLFAALVMGPSFFFSQFSAFTSSPQPGNELNSEYPPHGFRLQLIEGLLRHRSRTLLKESQQLRDRMKECLDLIDLIEPSPVRSIETNSNLLVLFESFQVFFREHFFSGEGTDSENYQKKFESMVRYVREIDAGGLEKIQASLRSNLPVPSKPKNGDSSIVEEATSVQEVLLGGWLARLGSIRDETLKELSKYPNGSGLREFVISKVEKFDNAVLRSLQLAEWLHLLGTESSSFEKEAAAISSDINIPQGSVLTDIQIANLLRSGALRVMPLIHFDQQLGSTSLDLRLGTSFEVYLPACRRTADQAMEGLVGSYDSRRIDLDFLEHVVLMPGQFMLGHSFEYLKLPDWLAAELDGRSSYARLGLEIHMTAGFIDPGFEGVVTFELYNGGPNAIPLFPGLRIGQLRFMKVSEPLWPYSKRSSAKYRGLLQHNPSLYMKDPDFKKIRQEIQNLEAKRSTRCELKQEGSKE
jgi:dCTP deaminase